MCSCAMTRDSVISLKKHSKIKEKNTVNEKRNKKEMQDAKS